MTNRNIPIEFMGMNAVSPHSGTTSTPRAAMVTSHIGQAPIIEGNEPRFIFTGIETKLSGYTFDVKIPEDCTILHVIRKYRQNNPMTVVIYEEAFCPNRTIGAIELPSFHQKHPSFGFNYVTKPNLMEQLAPGQTLEKGTVLATSSAVKSNGLYGMGLHGNVAFLTDQGCIEDGFVVSREWLDRMSPTTYSTFTANVGKRYILLNAYGDENNYQPFPHIGQKVREDGVVMALREINEMLPVLLTPKALMYIDPTFDQVEYGKPGGTVKDITVYHDNKVTPSALPTGLDEQLRFYYDSCRQFHSKILEIHEGLWKRRGASLVCNEYMNQLVLEAETFMPVGVNEKRIQRMYRLSPLDEWYVKIVVESKAQINLGGKITDVEGGKGVACVIKPAADMPRFANGVAADLVVYGGSTFRRSNFGRLYEQFFNACARDTLRRLRTELGWMPDGKPTKQQLGEYARNEAQVHYVWKELEDFFAIRSPGHHKLFMMDKGNYPRMVEATQAVLICGEYQRAGINVYAPVLDDVNLLDIVDGLRYSRFMCTHERVQYRDVNGEMVWTEDPVIMGDIYMLLLEKLGEDKMGVASAKQQTHGLPAKVTASARNNTPMSESPVKGTGESESRSLISTIGPIATARLMNQSNSPANHKLLVRTVLNAAEPTNIDLIPTATTSSRPVELVQHVLQARGVEFVRE